MMRRILLAGLLACLTAGYLTGRPGNFSSASERLSVEQKRQSKSERDAEKEKARAAQLLCGVVLRFIQAGSSGYSDLKSDRDFDDSDNKWVAYDSGVMFPGCRKCTIYTDRQTGADSFLTCKMLAPADRINDDQIKKWKQEVVEGIKPCIPRGWVAHTDTEPHPEGYFSMEEGSPGPRIEVQLPPARPGKPRELQINFYPK